MNEPSSVLLMTRSLGEGGSERQLTEMAIALAARGWNVHAACFASRGVRAADLEHHGIPVFPLELSSFRSPSLPAALVRLARYRRKHGLRILHSFDYPSNFIAALGGRACGFSHVITSQRSFRDLRSPFWRRVLRWTDRRADAIVVNCQALRRHMVEEELADPSRVLVCYNGLAAERFPVRPTPVPEAPPVIGLVCVLRPEKGLPILLEAFAAVSRTHPEAQLLIVGSGPEKDSLAALASTLGIASKCEWHPAAADVSPWLQRIDIFVLPSESEAFSNSLLEAMASGCAVIASAVGGTPELVETDQTGLLFPRRDAAALAQCLDRLLSSRADRLRLGTAAAAKVRDAYSISRSVATLDQIYSAVARSA